MTRALFLCTHNRLRSAFMQPELVTLLEARAGRFLKRA